MIPCTVPGVIDPEFQIDYWQVAYALGRALDSDMPEFWYVVTELRAVYPQFDWPNAMTDGPTKETVDE